MKIYFIKKKQCDHLELTRRSCHLTPCPLLLDFSTYHPDVVDLTKDDNAREYWLQCFKEATDKVMCCDNLKIFL